MYKILCPSTLSNESVTRYYIEIIKEAIIKKGSKVEYIKNIYDIKKEETIVVPTVIEAFKLMIFKNHKNIIVWMQGVLPEESYMKHDSKLRVYILNIIEKLVLKRASKVFFISKSMENHYENKYNLKFKDRSFIMPCFNTDINEKCFEDEKKYKNNIFTYVGSLAKWQCFEETLDIYKKIEQKFDCKIKIYTKDIELAKEILDSKKIYNYSVKYVENEKLKYELRDVKYGFIIRDDSTVNRVATPTKISTYLSCGVIPIYSDCIEDFFIQSKKLKYTVPVNDKNAILQISKSMKCNISNRSIYEEYNKLFKDYYNKEYYIKAIAQIL